MDYRAFAAGNVPGLPPLNDSGMAIPGLGGPPPPVSANSHSQPVQRTAPPHPNVVLPQALQNLSQEQLTSLLVQIQSGSLPFPPLPPPPPPGLLALQNNVPSPMPPNSTPATPDFTQNDFDQLLALAEDIQNVSIASYRAAWQQWAKENPTHSAQQWRDYFESTVLPAYVERKKRTVAPIDSAKKASTYLQVDRGADREEGEVSDSGMTVDTQPQESLGQRKRKNQYNTAENSRKARRMSNTQLQHVSNRATVTQSDAPPAVNKASQRDHLQRQHKEILPVIAALYEEGFTFDEVVKEVRNEELLASIYNELKLPIRPIPKAEERKPSPSSNAVTASVPQSVPAANGITRTNDTDPASVVQKQPESRKIVRPTGGTVARPGTGKGATPIDRTEYLARLKAARDGAKITQVPSPQSPAALKASTPSEPVLAADSPSAPLQTDAADKADAEKQNKTTELIRKKMEALKAMQKRREQLAKQTSATAQVASPTSGDSTGIFTSSTTSLLPPTLLPHEDQQGSIAPSSLPGFVTAPIDPATTGLSLSSSSTRTPSRANGIANGQPSIKPSPASHVKRRPVASDFIESSNTADDNNTLRPFGQSRYSSSDDAMIIEVSDEDSAPSDDEVDLDASKPFLKQGARNKRIQDFPPLRDFPQRASFGRQSDFTITSSSPFATPGALSEAEELKRKEKEIAALNKRIADIQKRKEASAKGKAKTESPASASSAPAPSPGLQSQQDLAAAMPVPRSETLAMTAGLPSLQQEAPAGASKKLQLQADLSARDAMINAKKAKMLEMQKHLEEMQREFEEETQAQQQLQQELQSYDIDTEGMSRADMEAKKEEIVLQLQDKDKTGPEPAVKDEQHGNFVQDKAKIHGSAVVDTRPSSSPASASVNGAVEPVHDSPDQVLSEEGELGQSPEAASNEPPIAQASALDDAEQDDADMEEAYSSEGSSASISIDTRSEVDMLNADEPVFQTNEMARLYLGNMPYAATLADVRQLFSAFDLEDVHIPINPKTSRPVGYGFVTVPVSQANEVIKCLDQHDLKGRKINIQMARPSEAPFPGPASAQVAPNVDESSDAEMDTSSDATSDYDSDSGSGAEEEVDNDQRVTPSVSGPSKAPSSSEVLPLDSEFVPLDQVDGGNDDGARFAATQPEVGDADMQGPSIADDLVPELQHNTRTALADKTETSSSSKILTQKFFETYKSPLKLYRKYRFHPDYSQHVAGGYRSKTYSNRIDPLVPLCAFETSGGACNDNDCPNQHERDFTIKDDEVLVQMGTGSANPGRSKAEIAEFNEGLKLIIKEMRSKESYTCEQVAERIASYRREFLQDPSMLVGID